MTDKKSMSDYFQIRRVANGFVAFRRMDMSGFYDSQDTFVFETAASLSAWVTKVTHEIEKSS